MADEVLIARFTTEIAGVKKQLEDYIATQTKVQSAEEKTQKEITQTATTAQGAAKRRSVLLKQELAELKRLEDSLKRAFSPAAIDNFNKKIAETKSRISTLRGETQNVGASIKASLTGIAAGFAAAFSLTAIIDGIKSSVNAFLEAEESANKLKFAVLNIAGEGAPAFDRLIEQAGKLQQEFGIADETIQAAQSALLSFGLSSAQVERALPALVDFAAVTGQDIPSAVQSMGQAIQGRAGDFKKFGIQVSETNTEIENFNAILEGLKSQQGAAAEQAETLTGQLKRQAAAADELQESIGSRLADSFTEIRFATLKLIETFIKLFDTVEQKRAAQSTRARELLKETIEANIAGDAAIENLKEEELAQKRLLETGKRLNEIKKEIQENPALFPRLDDERKKLIQTAGILKDFITLKKEQVEIDGRLLSADQLRALSTEKLTQLLKENAEQTSIEAQSNVKLINRELEARKKQTEENAKLLAKQLEDLKKLNGDAQKIPPIELKVNFDQEEIKPINPVPEKLELPPPDGTAFNDGMADIEAKTLKGWLDNNDKIISASQDLLNELVGLFAQISANRIAKIEKETEAELDALDERTKANEIALEDRAISEKDFAKQQREIEAQKARTQAEADKKIRDIKRKQFLADKAAALAEIIISTAKNVAENPELIAFYIAIGAAQGAIVAAQPVPYRKGTKSAKGGLSLVNEEGQEAILRGQKGTLTMLDKGDKVVPARKTKQFSKVFDAIIDDRFEDYVIREYVTPRLQKQKQEFQKQQEAKMHQAIASSIVNTTVNNTTSGGTPSRGDFYLERIYKHGIVIRESRDYSSITHRQSHKR